MLATLQNTSLWIGAGALCVAILSLGVSAFSLGWNVYRDVVLKPRLKAFINIMSPVIDGKLGTPMILVAATNHGPGTITCSGVLIQFGSVWQRLFRRFDTAVVDLVNSGNLGDTLPRKLDRSEEVVVRLEFTKDCLLSCRPFRVGFYDSFGRNHWAEARTLRRSIKRYDDEFGSSSSS